MFKFLKYFSAMPLGMWDLSSLTRDWTHAPLHWKLRVLITGAPGKLLKCHVLNAQCVMLCSVLRQHGHWGKGHVTRWQQPRGRNSAKVGGLLEVKASFLEHSPSSQPTLTQYTLPASKPCPLTLSWDQPWKEIISETFGKKMSSKMGNQKKKPWKA